MRIILQRVKHASVTVDQKVVGQIGHGLLLLVGAAPDDDQNTINKLADKIVNLRIFSDENYKFNHSLLDVQGSILAVSQFTLFADAKKGRRPSFTSAAPPDHAKHIFDQFVNKLKDLNISSVEQGMFGNNMAVSLLNDGPVTIILDSDEL